MDKGILWARRYDWSCKRFNVPTGTHRMQLKTILNRVQKHKSFVYGTVRMRRIKGRLSLEVRIHPRKNSRPVCSGCARCGPQYDRLASPRRFEFVPLWGIAVFFVYRMRRVDCRRCGVKVEKVPWGHGRSRLTTTYRWFLASWAKRLSWQEVADVFHTSWQSVFRSVRLAVLWGIIHRKWGRIEAIGIDEIAWRKGHKYLTLVYQIDAGRKRLLFVARERTEESLRCFFRLLPQRVARGLRFVCSDLWKPYLKVIREQAGQAVHVLDRFHIMSHFNKAIDEIRADEARRLKQDGYEPVLKHSRWCLLKRPENLTTRQTVKLAEVVKYNLRSVRAYLSREEFQRFWEYVSPTWAARFLDEWCVRTMRSKLEPLKRVARMLRDHRPLILHWFHARGTISAGVVEGFNNKAKLTTKKAYGFRTYEAIEIALYHQLADLPEPKFTHRFW
jgi:transposase